LQTFASKGSVSKPVITTFAQSSSLADGSFVIVEHMTTHLRTFRCRTQGLIADIAVGHSCLMSFDDWLLLQTLGDRLRASAGQIDP
jgi:hypothetical protein